MLVRRRGTLPREMMVPMRAADDRSSDRLVPPEPDDTPDEDARARDVRRRLVTLSFFGVIAVATWAFVVSQNRAVDPSGAHRAGRASPSTLPAGSYRLPGGKVPVSVTFPQGWRAGNSAWGPDGRGFAAFSTGEAGATIGLAVFDLSLLRPISASTGAPLAGPDGTPSFRGSIETYASDVEPRVRDRVVGRRLRWRPPAVLAWLLSHTERGPIEVADDVTIGGRTGDLASFRFAGPPAAILQVPEAGAITLRQGNRYTFWAARGHDALARTIVLGIARQPGAVTGTAEWDVVRTMSFGG